MGCSHTLYLAMFSTSVLLVLSTCVSLCHCARSHIYIEPAEGKRCPENISTCLNITDFGKMADSFSKSSNMVVYFLEGTHWLDLQKIVVFKGLHNAMCIGLGRMEQGFHETVWQSTVVITCTNSHKSSGIAFVGGSNITVKSITISNCGASLQFDYTVPRKVLSGESAGTLIFFRVANITVDQVSVQNGSGFGLFIFVYGSDVIIFSSSFAKNYTSCKSYRSGGNLMLAYSDPLECFYESQYCTKHTLLTRM